MLRIVLESNIKYTIKAMLAFIIGNEDIKMYTNQLNKSLEFLNSESIKR